MGTTALSQQVQQILDTTRRPQLQVIVQMESDTRASVRLARAAGQALSRRRLSLSPRELLPGPFSKPTPRSVRQATASQLVLMSTGTAAMTAAAIRDKRLLLVNPLLDSDIVKAAMGRMGEPDAAAGAAGPSRTHFWTSRAMPLLLTRDELQRLPGQVKGIKSIHVNRRLSLPNVVETQQADLEMADLLSCTWGIDRTKAPAVWGAYGARGQGTKIGLLDTGVDAQHPDLAGKVEAWAGFDAMGNPVPGSQAHDTGEHGTHCAGTLVGGLASGRRIGMAPEAKLAVGLVIDADKGGSDAQVLAGIDWAVEQGVDVISMSLGGLVMTPETPPTYTEAILTCQQAGIPVVIAIGNEGEQTTGSPGNDLFALSVGATDPRDRVAGFSGGRTQIITQSEYISDDYLPLAYSKPDLSAPGVAVFSSTPGGKWKAMSGTSMATPHVAGAIALLLSATGIKSKVAGADRAYLIQDLICGSVDDMGEAGQDHRYGFGRLDALRAVDFASARGY